MHREKVEQSRKVKSIRAECIPSSHNLEEGIFFLVNVYNVVNGDHKGGIRVTAKPSLLSSIPDTIFIGETRRCRN